MNTKRVTDSIIDEQLDIAALADEAYKAGKTIGSRIEMMAQRVMSLRLQGKLNAQRAKELLREGMLVLVLAEYADLVGSMQDLEDKALDEQARALAELGAPVTSVPFVKDADIAARITERESAALAEKE